MRTRCTTAAADLASAACGSSAAAGDASSVGAKVAKAKRASIEKRFMGPVPPDCKFRSTGHELHENQAAEDRQPQADEVRELLLDAGGVEGEEHCPRDDRDAELGEDVERPAAVLDE